jgi:serine/threonine protein kinase
LEAVKNNNNTDDSQSRSIVNVDINLNAHLILASDLQLGEEIGRGSSGVVYKAVWRGIEVAVKQLLSSKQMSTKEIHDFIAEISVMASLRPHGKSEFVYQK